MNIEDYIVQRLFPEDPLEIPQPGFPSGVAFTDVVVEYDHEQVINLLLPLFDMNNDDFFPQQYIAMAVLRRLGVDIYLSRIGKSTDPLQPENPEEDWVITLPG